MSVRRLIMEVDPTSMNVTGFCRDHGVSTWLFWQLRRRYAAEGEAALESGVLAAGVAGELARLPTAPPGEPNQPEQLLLSLGSDVVEVGADEVLDIGLCARRTIPVHPGGGPQCLAQVPRGRRSPSRRVVCVSVSRRRARRLPPGVLGPSPDLLTPPLLVANSQGGDGTCGCHSRRGSSAWVGGARLGSVPPVLSVPVAGRSLPVWWWGNGQGWVPSVTAKWL